MTNTTLPLVVLFLMNYTGIKDSTWSCRMLLLSQLQCGAWVPIGREISRSPGRRFSDVAVYPENGLVDTYTLPYTVPTLDAHVNGGTPPSSTNVFLHFEYLLGVCITYQYLLSEKQSWHAWQSPCLLLFCSYWTTLESRIRHDLARCCSYRNFNVGHEFPSFTTPS